MLDFINSATIHPGQKGGEDGIWSWINSSVLAIGKLWNPMGSNKVLAAFTVSKTVGAKSHNRTSGCGQFSDCALFGTFTFQVGHQGARHKRSISGGNDPVIPNFYSFVETISTNCIIEIYCFPLGTYFSNYFGITKAGSVKTLPAIQNNFSIFILRNYFTFHWFVISIWIFVCISSTLFIFWLFFFIKLITIFG